MAFGAGWGRGPPCFSGQEDQFGISQAGAYPTCLLDRSFPHCRYHHPAWMGLFHHLPASPHLDLLESLGQDTSPAFPCALLLLPACLAAFPKHLSAPCYLPYFACHFRFLVSACARPCLAGVPYCTPACFHASYHKQTDGTFQHNIPPCLKVGICHLHRFLFTWQHACMAAYTSSPFLLPGSLFSIFLFLHMPWQEFGSTLPRLAACSVLPATIPPPCSPLPIP